MIAILGVDFADRIRLATYDLLGHYCDGWGKSLYDYGHLSIRTLSVFNAEIDNMVDFKREYFYVV